MSIMEDHGHMKEAAHLEHANHSGASTIINHPPSKTSHVRIRIAIPNPAYALLIPALSHYELI